MKRYINQLRDNEKVEDVFQITEKQLRPNKNGNLYLQFNLSDKTGMVGGRFWNVDEELFYQFENGDYVLADGATQRFQGTLQFIAKKLTKVDLAARNLDPSEFRRFDAVDIPGRTNELRELLRSVKNPDLRNLADVFLIDDAFMDLFCRAPAGVKLHHACPGGLLDHTVQMMKVADRVSGLYPRHLDRDLLLFGAFLHDIGKVRELSYDDEMLYTDSGQMLGHPLLGVEMLEEKIREVVRQTGETFDQETAMLLKHMLISHHGTYENQSAKLPMTLEAVALHFIDSLDSKLAEFHKYVTEDPNLGGVWTNYLPGIERKLYKGRPKSPEPPK